MAEQVTPARTKGTQAAPKVRLAEVTALPDRNYKRKAGEAFYDILRRESKDPLS